MIGSFQLNGLMFAGPLDNLSPDTAHKLFCSERFNARLTSLMYKFAEGIVVMLLLEK